MKKKIFLSIIYFFVVFLTIASSSIIFSGKSVYTNEVSSGYITKNSRIELKFSDDSTKFVNRETNNTNVREWIDGNELKYTKLYYESYYDEQSKPLVIDNHPTKVLLTDSKNNNYFGIELKKGELPDGNSFVISESMANFYSISNADFPVSIKAKSVCNGEDKTNNLIISGIYKNSNNKYINKLDCRGNDCSDYTLIGNSSNNIDKFGAFIDVLEFLRGDKISNAFVIVKILPMLGGIIEIKAFDSFLTYEENENYTQAIVSQRNCVVNKELVINADNICIPILIASTLALTVLSYYMMRTCFNERKNKFNLFHYSFLCMIISMFVLFEVYSIKINEKILFVNSFASSMTNAITLSFVFIILLSVSILADSINSKKNSLLEEDMVSVIIPCYNGSKYIRKAVESALGQTYKNIEIIVVNDGSNDNGQTEIVLKDYIEQGKIQYYKKENGGVSSALNFGTSKAKGKYINWLSHDDLFIKDSIFERIRVIKENTANKIIVSSSVGFIDENGAKMNRIAAGFNNINSISILMKSTVNGCTLLIPKEAFENHKFREGMIFMQDYFMWASLINDGYSFININKKTVLNRVHNEQVTNKHPELREKDFAEFYKTYIVPLKEERNYCELRSILLTLQKRAYLHPFYSSYIEDIKSFLKVENSYDLWDKLDITISKMIGKTVLFIRKLMKQ